jgi:hypothetical protein
VLQAYFNPSFQQKLTYFLGTSAKLESLLQPAAAHASV